VKLSVNNAGNKNSDGKEEETKSCGIDTENEMMKPEEDEECKKEELARLRSREMNSNALNFGTEKEIAQIKMERDCLKKASDVHAEEFVKLQATMSERNLDLQDQAKRLKLVSEENDVFHKERLQRANLESESLREDISRVEKSNATLNTNLAQMKSQYKCTASSVLPLRLELERSQKDVASLTKHVKWLESELESRISHVKILKSSHSEQLVKLKTEMDTVQSENDSLHSLASSLKSDFEQLQSCNNKLRNDLRHNELDYDDALCSKDEEIASSKRMTLLLKDKSEQIEHRFDSASKDGIKLKNRLDEVSRERDDIRKQMDEEKFQCVKEMSERDDITSDLNKKLIKSEEVCEKLQKDLNLLLPFSNNNETDSQHLRTAIVVRRSDDLEEPRPPTTLTDILDRLATTEDKLRDETMEKRRLELYVERMKVDFESKDPLIQQLRREYKLAKQVVEDTNNKLLNALRKQQTFKDKAEEALQKLFSKRKRGIRIRTRERRFSNSNTEIVISTEL